MPSQPSQSESEKLLELLERAALAENREPNKIIRLTTRATCFVWGHRWAGWGDGDRQIGRYCLRCGKSEPEVGDVLIDVALGDRRP